MDARSLTSAISHGVNQFTIVVGKAVGCIAISVTVGLLFYEVVMRYVFNSPTSFTLEAGLIMQVVLVACSSAYALIVGAHVKMELLTERLPYKASNWLGVFNEAVGVLFCLLLCVEFFRAAMWSYKVGNYTEMMELPLAPLQFLMAGGMLLLAFQFLVRARNCYTRTRTEDARDAVPLSDA